MVRREGFARERGESLFCRRVHECVFEDYFCFFFAALSRAGTIQRVLGDKGAACDFGVGRAGKVEQNWG